MTIVKDIMTSPVITGHMDSTIGEIYSFFKSKNIHHLPIVHDNHLAGLISDSDIVMALSPYWGTAAAKSRYRYRQPLSTSNYDTSPHLHSGQ
ncbi:CBS domain-containing protein [Piscirickettsia salmonis]|uniref:CBS domain-containing protein n=1 Tax=Piscirickettsia salmonis TaxID=1238 RepID=UPI001013D57F